MWDWRYLGRLLADDLPEAANGAADAAQDKGPGTLELVLYVFGPAMLVFMLVNALMGGPQKKEKARREQLLSTLKKNDQVVTIGGIYGTVVNVSEDKTAVTIRVDDHAKIKVRLDAIREVVSRPGEETSTDKS